MDSTVEVKTLLTELAAKLDAPDGPGSGAVCLAAVTEIEALEKRPELPPPDPGTSS